MQPQDHKADGVIADQGAAAFGVLTWWELTGAGVSPEEIRQRVGRGALVRVHRGVYRVGGAPETPDSSYRAAVCACGSEAALGGTPAAWRYRVVKGPPPPPEVIAPKQRRVPGVRTRVACWPHTEFRGVETLTVPATLVDIAGRLGIEDLARACHEAGVRYRVAPRHVDAVLRRKPNARGAANLRLVLSGDERVTLSRLEKAFLSLLRAECLPLPITNKPAGAKRVDCRWPEHRLTVELDSFTFHNSRHAWQQSYIREREAYARHDRFRRYTWADVFEDSAQMLTELNDLLT